MEHNLLLYKCNNLNRNCTAIHAETKYSLDYEYIKSIPLDPTIGIEMRNIVVRIIHLSSHSFFILYICFCKADKSNNI